MEPTPIRRRLCDELRPAYRQIQEAVERATAAPGGVGGTLRVGVVGAGAAHVVLEVAEAFRAEQAAAALVGAGSAASPVPS